MSQRVDFAPMVPTQSPDSIRSLPNGNSVSPMSQGRGRQEAVLFFSELHCQISTTTPIFSQAGLLGPRHLIHGAFFALTYPCIHFPRFQVPSGNDGPVPWQGECSECVDQGL